MPRETQERREPISVSSEVLARLGEELITNHIQALAELIKNSYDADATSVQVEIKTDEVVEDGDGKVRRGRITIADNGFGMDVDAVRNGWLRVSASRKRAMKRAGNKTPRKRTPLGDKGLGRLGAQRLGDRLRIRSRPENADGDPTIEHDVSFAFSDLRADLDVSQIRVPWKSFPLPEQQDQTDYWPVKRKMSGTVIEITGLANPADWEDTQELERALSLLVNPFRGVERFRVHIRVDGIDLNLRSVAADIRDAALIRWEGTFDGETLSLDGVIRLRWFALRETEMNDRLNELTAADKGAGLLSFAREQAEGERFAISAGSGNWLLKLDSVVDLADLDHKGLALSENGGGDWEGGKSPVSPGEFLFEFDVISRRIGVARAAGFSALDKQAMYTEWLNERGGVHVYRDGFRINLGSDVMELGEAFSSSSSYYGLRPKNVIGYVEISAENNPGLQETTDREGFRETPEVRAFWRLIGEIRDRINGILDVLGRSALAYVRDNIAPGEESTEELSEELTEAAELAAGARPAVVAARTKARSVRESSGFDSDEASSALEQAEEALAGAEKALERVASARKLGVIVRQDLVELEERVANYAQLIGVGLVAETLAHELHQVTSRLGSKVEELEAQDDLPGWARSYLQDTRSAMDALNGHLRHLDPMLRYAQTRRERISLGEISAEVVIFHTPRLRDQRIAISANVEKAAEVQANRGRLMQVFDNLIINSEYWLEQAIRSERIAEGKIEVEVSGHTISFSDNGPGVDPAIERKIFDPFVTAKADRGRGLGLFICRQLLDLDGASIELGEHRDAAGRADTFEVTFEQSADEAQ
jgi:signal transduction histidine kinase